MPLLVLAAKWMCRKYGHILLASKKYLTDYPQSEDTKQAFMDEIKAWENVLNNYKLVKPYAINHRERQQVKSKK